MDRLYHKLNSPWILYPLVAVVSFIALSHVYGLDATVRMDTVNDFLTAEICLQNDSCEFSGLPTSFPGIIQGGLWKFHLVFLKMCGLSREGTVLVSYLCATMAVLLIFYLASSLGSISGGFLATSGVLFSLVYSNYMTTQWNPTLVPFFAALWLVALLLAVKRRSLWHHLFAAVFLSLMIQTHPVTALYLPFAIIILFLFPPQKFILTLLIWPLVFLGSMFSLSASAILESIATFDFTKIHHVSHFKSLDITTLLIYFAIFATLFYFAYKSKRFKEAIHKNETIAIIIIGIFPMTLMMILLYLTGKPVWFRYLIPYELSLIFCLAYLLDGAIHQLIRFVVKTETKKLKPLIFFCCLFVFLSSSALAVSKQYFNVKKFTFYETNTLMNELSQSGISTYSDLYYRLRSPSQFAILNGALMYFHENIKDLPEKYQHSRETIQVFKTPGDIENSEVPGWKSFKIHNYRIYYKRGQSVLNWQQAKVKFNSNEFAPVKMFAINQLLISPFLDPKTMTGLKEQKSYEMQVEIPVDLFDNQPVFMLLYGHHIHSAEIKLSNNITFSPIEENVIMLHPKQQGKSGTLYMTLVLDSDVYYDFKNFFPYILETNGNIDKIIKVLKHADNEN